MGWGPHGVELGGPIEGGCEVGDGLGEHKGAIFGLLLLHVVVDVGGGEVDARALLQ